MAATTLKAIIDRVQAVCEAAPLQLVKAKDAFSHQRQPNGLLTDTYFIEDGGIVSSVEQGNNAEARIDALHVHLARKVAFNGTLALETLETDLLTLERYLLADGPNNSYYPRVVNRRTTRPKDKDFVVGTLTVNVDFDVDKSVSA